MRRHWRVILIIATSWISLCIGTRVFARRAIESYLQGELVERRAAIIESEKWEFPQYAEEHRQLPWHPKIKFDWIVSPAPGIVVASYDTVETDPNCDMGRISAFSCMVGDSASCGTPLHGSPDTTNRSNQAMQRTAGRSAF